MLNHINISGVFVLDQDEALDFYVNKLDLEVSNDVDLGFMRWLTTDDCRKTYETLVERGVEITQEPTTRDYGTDIGVRDPFGNHIRIVQPSL